MIKRVTSTSKNKPKLTETQKILYYLIHRLKKSGLLEGRKKIMKLMFFIEHFDLGKGKLSKNRFVGNDFIIYHYGVFSFNVMEDYLSLLKRGIISENPITLKRIEVCLSEDKKDKVKGIIEKFGERTASDLENLSLELLGLSRDTKKEHLGESVVESIIRQGEEVKR